MLRRTALAALLCVAAGCAQPDSVGERPESTAKLAILTPADGATVTSPVAVKLDLKDARIVPEGKSSKDVKPNTGHLHVSVGGKLISQTFALDEQIEVEPGTWQLTVEFVAADHSPFNPRVIETSTFTVD